MKLFQKVFIVLVFALPLAVQIIEWLPQINVNSALWLQFIMIGITGIALLQVLGMFLWRATRH